jgi:hypothetical protein
VPPNQPKDISAARIGIIEVHSGRASIGEEFDVRFMARDGGQQEDTYPFTPDQKKREYVVVMYLDPKDSHRRLVPFPIGELQYLQWNAEGAGYERSRSKPGFQE